MADNIRMRTRASLIIVLLTVLFLFGSCDFFFDHFEDWEDPDTPSEPVEPGEDGDNDDNVLLGLPSQPSLADGTKLIEHSAYTVLYSYNLLMPIWVSWHLDASDSGDFPRPSRFSPDPDLPEEYQVSHDDYTNSGFARGHMCPDADRNGNEEIQKETYYTTNIIPQNSSMNSGDWSQLEKALREYAANGYELYIVAGAVQGSTGGTDKDGKVLKEWKSEKGDVTITVPSQIWKAFVIITQDDSKDDLERIKNGETPVYASGIIMDNAPFDGSWTDAVVSIDEIEELTGLDLFSALPDTIETELESGTAAELPEVA